MRAIDSARSRPYVISLAIMLSVGRDLALSWMNVSMRTPGPPGRFTWRMVPGDGTNVTGSSALMRHSRAWPCQVRSFCENERGSPCATRICSFTRSRPVTSSVTPCSTWMRVFISMK